MGGRGSKSYTPKYDKRKESSMWSGGMGQLVPRTLKEAIGVKTGGHSIENSVELSNTRYSRNYAEYSMNCQRCVVAYEMNRRGYNVDALPTYSGDTLPNVVYRDVKRGTFEGKWKGAFRDAKTINVGERGNDSVAQAKVINNIESQMLKWGNGSRAVIQVFWKMGGGHVYNVENVNGRIRYVDAQIHDTNVSIKDRMARTDTNSVNLVRTDNLRVSERMRNFVEPRRRK